MSQESSHNVANGERRKWSQPKISTRSVLDETRGGVRFGAIADDGWYAS